MLVDNAFLSDVNHGSQKCIGCHQGDPAGATRAMAHVGLVPDPTVTAATNSCSCHGAIVASSANSLHTTLNGIRSSLAERAGTSSLGPELGTVFGNHCSRCHSSCGNCHVSVPAAAGGGLLSGHRFVRKPPMNLVCTACHGSRVGDEYRGLNPGVPADVHYNQGMQCTACHTGAEMHGEGQGPATHRYQVTSAPACADCHPDDAAFKATASHSMHREAGGALKLACQVCHAANYKNCSTCHVSLNAEQKPIYEVNAPSHQSVMGFKIGFNPARDAGHPEKFVTLRHVPAHPDNYSFYGPNLQPAYEVNPTWRPATPHNSQRTPARAADCGTSCHGQRALFLSTGDLDAYEQQANARVVVPDGGFR
ncbi:MAG: hypothetical protein ACYC8T_06685 [Myxococcaceae bacterium]